MSLRSLLRVLGHAVAMTIAAGAAQAAPTVVYVANADSQEVSVLALDRASGALTPIETIAWGDDAPELWKEWRGQGEAILMISAIGDDGTDMNETIIPKCR